MDLTVKDLRRHMDPVEGKTLSDFQIHCFLLMHQAMKDAKAEKEDLKPRYEPEDDWGPGFD